MIRTVNVELEHLLGDLRFVAFHGKCGPGFRQTGIDFLRSTMDDVRTTRASSVALLLLDVLGVADAELFRRAVLRRELGGVIDYSKQRDHSSHTVYNYLLGWYMYIHSKPIRNALNCAFACRGVPRSRGPWPLRSREHFFGCIWQNVSLLHDIGYIFEGGVPGLSLRSASEQAALGSGVVQEYFDRLAWLEHALEVRASREAFLGHLPPDLLPPMITQTGSLGATADSLRTLGSLESLFVWVREDMHGSLIGPRLSACPLDTFQLWADAYTRARQRKMAGRMLVVRSVFNRLIDRGLPPTGTRMLDHGVCSGLLQLLVATYYYRLYAAAKELAPAPKAIGDFLNRCTWSPAYWWSGIVWSSAAAAIHNIAQIEDIRDVDENWPGKLSLSEDPLAYLGVLVDMIQEWDRYDVFRKIDSESIQNTDLGLGCRSGHVVVQFLGKNGRKRARALRDKLDAVLSGWRAVLQLEFK